MIFRVDREALGEAAQQADVTLTPLHCVGAQKVRA
jgi:hypothetical protein